MTTTTLSPPMKQQRRATVESNMLENEKLITRTTRASSPIPEEYQGVVVVVAGLQNDTSNFV
jgi:hypothetical protein